MALQLRTWRCCWKNAGKHASAKSEYGFSPESYMKILIRSLLFFMFLIVPVFAGAQQSSPAGQVEVPSIAPRAEDVSSIDGIMKAFYEVISGPAGQARQWSRDRTLYIPDIRFVMMSEDKSGNPKA